MNIAVFCSGSGTNLQAIIDAQKRGYIKAVIKIVVSDVADCYALIRAKKAGIKTLVVEKGNFKSKDEFDRHISDNLKYEKIDLIVLAGYMRLLTRAFINEYKNKICRRNPLQQIWNGGSGGQLEKQVDKFLHSHDPLYIASSNKSPLLPMLHNINIVYTVLILFT